MSSVGQIVDITGLGSAPSGAASGDLGESYPAPAVLAINGAVVPEAGALTIGNVLQADGSASLTYAPINLAGGAHYVTGTLPAANIPTLDGDVSGVITSCHVVKLNSAIVPSAGSLVTGNVLQVDGASSLSYAPLNLAGGSNYVSGALPTANQVAQSLSGDLSGTTSSATVVKINGTSISSSPSNHQVLIASGATSSSWALIADANVSSSAAIAASKLAYSDAASPVLGSTTVQGAIDAVKTQAIATAIQRLTQTISTADIQALGALATGSINIGSSLPSNARVLGVEFHVTQALAALGLSVAVATVQGSTDVAGSLVAAATILSTGYFGGTGINQYLTRGGQQLTITFTLTGALLSALTAGALTVNVFYAVIP